MRSDEIHPNSLLAKRGKMLDGRKKRRKHFVVTQFPPRKARGSAHNFEKRPIAERKPIMGDNIFHNEDSLWLQAGER